jgi:predicted amidophosphoribosyltransferase
MGHNRNRELGDRCGFCLTCGWGRRFMDGAGDDLPSTCPDCGGTIVSECPSCGAAIVSLMGITCRECGQPLRDATLFGIEIRRKPEKVAAVDADAKLRDNVNTSP